MKRLLLITLLLSVGFSQHLTEAIKTYENGNIESITYHKKTRDVIEKVKYERYYENGQKEYVWNYKDGKEDGLHTYWYENGKKKEEGTFKDGERDGLFTRWYENGKKSEVLTFKNGLPDGKYNEWHEDGQKYREQTFKDGKLISKKEWNEDGSVKE